MRWSQDAAQVTHPASPLSLSLSSPSSLHIPSSSPSLCRSQLLNTEPGSGLRECHHWRHPAFLRFPRPALGNRSRAWEREHTHTHRYTLKRICWCIHTTHKHLEPYMKMYLHKHMYGSTFTQTHNECEFLHTRALLFKEPRAWGQHLTNTRYFSSFFSLCCWGRWVSVQFLRGRTERVSVSARLGTTQKATIALFHFSLGCGSHSPKFPYSHP